jgi:hypothetical protein
MGMGMGSGFSEGAADHWTSEERKVMIRALDFTAEPDNTYRYRVRIVVANPNLNREDTAAGVDRKTKQLLGPWSKETDEVTMPPDVAPYAMGTLPASGNSGPKLRLQVVRFNPSDGVTVPHRFDSGVGELVGEPYNEEVPVSDGSGKKREPIDFSTRQIVLDLEGGGLQVLPTGMLGAPITRPAFAALLRPDGSVAVHIQADDEVNEVRKDIEANYKHELAQSNKKRESSQGSGYAGMMGMMGRGGMGGGYGGRGRMGQ